jgi:hypothetical protein
MDKDQQTDTMSPFATPEKPDKNVFKIPLSVTDRSVNRLPSEGERKDQISVRFPD